MNLFKSYENKVDGVIHYYDLKRTSNKIGIIVIYILCSLLAIIFMYPMIWLISASLKNSNELWTNPSLIPWEIDMRGLTRTFMRLDYGNSYFWSLYLCAGTIVCSIVFNGLAGYALGVVKMRGSKLYWGLLMALMLIPSTGGFIVLFRLFINLDLNDGSMWPLYLGAGASPYQIMIFKVFFENIPRDYVEAARLDGATNLGIFARIILPLSKPILAITAIECFTGAWSNFLMPYLMLQGTTHYTVMVKLFAASGQSGVVLDQIRASLFSILPPVIFFCIFQKYIMNNNTAAGVKG